MGIKVVKFGGSSLADASQFKKVADIVKSDSNRKFVIPSAPGKRFSDDNKITDLLYKCYDSSGDEFESLFNQIKERFFDIVNELSLKTDLEKEFSGIRHAFLHRAGRDYAASRGEYLNGILLAEYLGFEFINAAEIIHFKDDGSFDSEKTNKIVKERLERADKAVIPGFYGSMPNDTIKTFSRGGSDITGSIVARATNAEIYENWTDVSGFLAADPRIINNPKNISVITYKELRELSYMGATVLHEDAIFPVRKAGIPIVIKNTNAPDAAGTLIVPEGNIPYSDKPNLVTGIAGKKGFSILNLEKDMMNGEYGFIRKLLTILEESKISVEHIPSGIDTLSVIVSSAELYGKEDDLIERILEVLKPDHISIENNIALIAVVGRGMVQAKGTAAKIFSSIADSGINIRMIDQGSSELNIILGIDESDFEITLNEIYKAVI